ncbi:hypothetical protein AAFN87_12240 [Solibacillus sp. CAU 1738]
MKFLQAVGVSILLTVVISFILGFIPINNFAIFLFIQTILAYGSIGYFGAKWNLQAPYTAAYLGAVVIALINLLLSHFIFNILVFVDAGSIARSISLAVIVSMMFAVVTIFIKNKREGALS